MKKYCIQVVTNEHWVTQIDLLQDLLDEGWKIERADATDNIITYILYKEVIYND